jgi:putative SOS response-associated peptidase YedK
MADRYTLFEIDKLRDRFHLINGVPAGVKKNYNISPTQLGSVIVNRDGVNVLEQMKWGFIPATAKDTNSVFRYKTFLAKSEDVFSKPSWQGAIRTSRCLIPANGFYEWQQTTDGKLPFYVRPKDQDLFSFAGIYSSWTDPAGVTWGTYAIVTTQYDRYPKKPLQRAIILSPADEAQWLDPTISDVSTLYGIMRPSSDDMLQIHQVSPDVKNVKANNERLILPIS